MRENEKGIFFNRVLEAVDFALSGKGPKYLGFFDEITAENLKNQIKKTGFDHFLFSGGFEGATRKMLGIFPVSSEPAPVKFPISRLTGAFCSEKKLSHKDFLGAIINSGIKREAIGDIFVAEKHADVFVNASVALFVANNVTKVSGTSVKFTLNETPFISPQPLFTELKTTVSSPRLDAVLSALLNISREKSASLIKSKEVTLNYTVCTEGSRTLSQGDKISIRGKGKFVIAETENKTRKNRYVLRALRYS